MKKVKNFIKKYKNLMIATVLNLVGLLIGSFVVGFIEIIIILLILDVIFYLVTKPKKKFCFKELIKSVLIVCFIGGICSLIGASAFIGYVIANADEFDPDALHNKVPTVIYGPDGQELAKLGDELRVIVDYENFSQSLIDAVIATEDSRYYQHSGVDLPRFLVASVNQVLGNDAGGASTLTMQVSKLTQTSAEASGIEGIIRKFTDVYISVFEIETRYTKEEILEFYLNYVNMGGRINGVGQAALTYFGKDVSELNIAESAMLAGMFQAPSSYTPTLYPDACEERRKEVLYLMHRHGYITQEEYDIALELTVEELLVENEDTVSSDYQDFLDVVIEEVEDRTGYDPYVVPMKIYTTIDYDMQTHVDLVMSGDTFDWPDDHIQAGSVIIEAETGQIKAIAGGRDRVAGDWNFAVHNERHMGSTSKPIYDYAPAIEYLNYNTYSPIVDEPHSYSGGINLNNWDGRYMGILTFHNALKLSRNTTALKLFQELDNYQVNSFVTSLGLTPESDSDYLYEGHSIGAYVGESPLSVATAYAAFTNGGFYVEPHTITSITFIDTDDTINIKPDKQRVMSEETAYMIAKILEDTSSHAVGLSVNGVNYAAKTGSTDIEYDIVKELGLNGDVNDKWMASFNDTYSMAVWLGYQENNKETYRVSSFNYIQELFQALAKGAYTEKSYWEQPDGVIQLEVEAGLPFATLPSEFTPEDQKVSAYFKKGFEPTEVSERFAKLDNVTNLNYNEETNSLTWDALPTPNFYNPEYLTQLYDEIYNHDNYLETQVNAVLAQNNEILGTLGYDIYIKGDDGSLTLIGSTTDTHLNYKTSESTTFVVKAAYTKFKSNSSDGTELNIEVAPTIITAEINGESTIDIELNETYSEPNKPIIVLENGSVDVTASSTITKVITKTSDDMVVTEIDTSTEEIYTIVYTIKYNDFTTKLTKIINVS